MGALRHRLVRAAALILAAAPAWAGAQDRTPPANGVAARIASAATDAERASLLAAATTADWESGRDALCAALQQAEPTAEFRALDARAQAAAWSAALAPPCGAPAKLVLDAVVRVHAALDVPADVDPARTLRTRALEVLPRGDRPRLLFRLARAASGDGRWRDRRDLALAGLAVCAPGKPHHPWRVALHELAVSAFLAAGLVDRAAQEQARADALLEEWRAQTGDDKERAAWRTAWIDAAPSRAELLATQDDFAGVVRLCDEVEAQVGGVADATYPAALLLARGVAEANLERADAQRAPRAEASLRAYAERAGVSDEERSKARIRLVRLALGRGALDVARAEIAACGLAPDAGVDAAPPTPRWRARDWAWLCALSADVAGAAGDDAALRVARDRLARAWGAVVEAWIADTPPPGGLSRLHYENARHALCSLVRATRVLDGDDAAARLGVAEMLRVQGCGWLARELAPEGGGDVAEVQARLCSERGGLLIYLPGPAWSFAFAVDRGRVSLHELASRDAIEPRRRALRDALGDDDADVARIAAAAALSELVMPAELQARIAAWDALDVQGLDLLQDLPFEILPIADGRPLGVAIALGSWPSLPVALAVERAWRASVPVADAPQLLVVASPLARVDATLGELPALPPVGADRLARWDAHYANSAQRSAMSLRVLQGSDATAARVGDELRRGPRILQVVAHGIRDPDSERPPGILLAADAAHDGRWWCREIDAIAGPQLALLGVCSAGRGAVRRGDGASSSLEGAWFCAGAGCVLLGAADLEYHAALELFDALHARIARGETPAAALRAVRAERFVRQGLADPLWSAQLRVSGVAHRPLFAAAASDVEPASSGSRAIAIAAIVAAAAIAVAVARARRRAGARDA